MPNPASFLAHLQTTGYHPRAHEHSDALADAIVADLLNYCPGIRKAAAAGRLVYALNFTILSGTAEWNVDLVLGEPPIGQEPPAPGKGIVRGRPSTVQIAIEIKGVMTEHHKAVKNRKRDLEAHHDHVHRYNPLTIAGGVLVINGSQTFLSPLRKERTTHRQPSNLIKHCIDQLRAVAVRGGSVGTGLDAKCGIVLDMDNENHLTTSYVTNLPAPQVGDPLHYDAFIQSICAHYSSRFS